MLDSSGLTLLGSQWGGIHVCMCVCTCLLYVYVQVSSYYCSMLSLLYRL